MIPGGIGLEKIANDHIQHLIDQLENDIKTKARKSYTHLKAIGYKTQIVAGINYFIKVDAGNGEYLHVRVFEPLPCYGNKPELSSIQVSKKRNDAIEYF